MPKEKKIIRAQECFQSGSKLSFLSEHYCIEGVLLKMVSMVTLEICQNYILFRRLTSLILMWISTLIRRVGLILITNIVHLYCVNGLYDCKFPGLCNYWYRLRVFSTY